MSYFYAGLCTFGIVLLGILFYYLADKHLELLTYIFGILGILGFLVVVFISFLLFFD